MKIPRNQVRKRFILQIPAESVDQPIVYEMCRECAVSFNILKASISPERGGHVVIELAGTSQGIAAALLYLAQRFVQVESLNEGVRRHEDMCIHCGTCEGFCPTRALAVERPSMRVVFDDEKCVLCERCLTGCPTHAMAFRFR